MKQTIFVSSVQKELAAERQAIREFVRNDPLLGQFFDIFLFEDMPASDRRADEVYLSQVDRCGVYVGIFGTEYGAEDRKGVSPTEREFDRATEEHKPRLVFVKGKDNHGRDPKMAALIKKAGDQLVRRRFLDVADLKTALYASLVAHLQCQGMIQTGPFEQQACPRAGLADIDDKAIAAFVRRAHNERRFPLAESASAVEVLTHLHLLEDGRVSNAAILLFGRDPQRFMACSEVRCMHFHGTEIQRPVPFYQIFKGNLFGLVDQAVDFVLSKVNRSVGTRAEGPRAPVRYELPEDVVAEAIVNAVVHRDYTSSGAIQVSVFADRVEVWNPGELLPPLTAESLRKPHRSILRNTRIAEALYLAHYIEKYGTGTLMMIRESVDYALPEPRFGTEEPGEFGITIWRDWLTEEVLDEFGLTERQRQIVATVKAVGRVANTEVQDRVGVSKRTAHRELSDLVRKGLLTQVGATGKGTFYALRKGAIKGPKGPSAAGGVGAQGTMPRHRNSEPSRDQDDISRIMLNDSVLRHVEENCKEVTAPVTAPVNDYVRRLLDLLESNGALGNADILHAFELKSRRRLRETYIHPALKDGLVEMTIPDKSRSCLQKYQLTLKGRKWLETSRRKP